ncbi:uncharacterized protein LOC129600276 isoform X2 [Paramacrobiotus metropolitanus]|uniref:uncharacterized protein LOC129600276 isoform X2 n=1 Tax=Paramacrobiotus metropolitanus TaxID=2943436 RepID=UPI0024456C06|nr:uncharacterized protein LOC129600276 isoform X2 [Paramacrobiotus metropolitanus]
MPWPASERLRQTSDSDYHSASDGSLSPEHTEEISPDASAQPAQKPQEPANANEDGELEFCEAVGRPDREVVPGKVVSNEMLVRVSKRATHVLMRGTIGSLVDPLRCPFGLEEGAVEACVTFRAGMPQGLKAHLERVHGMHKVQLNFACPCPAEFNDGADCPFVQFDPFGDILPDHIREHHPVYKERVMEALYKQRSKKFGEKYREFLRTGKSQTFPEGTSNLGSLWPSQIIADRIIIPTRVDKNGQVQYVCKIDACAAKKDGHQIPSSYHMFAHLMMQHRGRCAALATQVYHACADPECLVQLFEPYHLMDSHIKAAHPHLLGLAYKETALQERAKLEALVRGQCIGEALNTSVDSEESEDSYLFHFTCPVQGCRVCHSERDYMLWHIGADHEKDWNVQPVNDQ